MGIPNNLNRYIDAQENKYQDAFDEIQNGRKESHWMWYVFPQISGLGRSELAIYYAIKDLEEAQDYLEHPVLGPRLINISKLLLGIKGKTAYEIFGSPDDMKLRSCMTLFSSLINTDPVFQQVLDAYFEGKKDERTLNLI
jgi:uncharacterized protein (DUF1810 family)